MNKSKSECRNKNLKNPTKELSSSDDEHDGMKLCPYCQKKFKRLGRHQPYCRAKPHDEEHITNATKRLSLSDNDDGKKLCPYCKKKFKRLGRHQPYCRAKPHDEEHITNATKRLSLSDNDDGKKLCPYCKKKFKRLGRHQPYCRAKPHDEEHITNAIKELSSSDDEDDGMKLCPYCKKKFKRLGRHQPYCRAKPHDEEHITNAIKEMSSSDDEDDGMKLCPYCQKKFKCSDRHQPYCRAKPHDEEHITNATKGLSLSDDDDGKKLCPYCKKTFKRLEWHQPWCQAKPHDEEDITNATKELSLSDDKYIGVKLCPYCKDTFKRLDKHQNRCPFNPCTNDIKKEPPPSHEINFRNHLKDIRLSQQSIVERSAKINSMIEQFFGDLSRLTRLTWKRCNTGSYYAKVKILKPDEFDFMLYPPGVQCRIEPSTDHPCYSHVFITNKQMLPLKFQDTLGPDNELTPSKFKEYVFEIIDQRVKNTRGLERLKGEPTCPAYTLRKHSSKYDYYTDIDLVPSLHVRSLPASYTRWETILLTKQEKNKTNVYVVPKTVIANGKELELWRISFSLFEKDILKKCDTNDRLLIRVLKSILAKVKNENSKLCSYHILTFCLHLFNLNQDKNGHLREYTLLAIDRLISDLKSRNLQHFFVQDCNLLQDVDVEEIQSFIQELECHKKEWTGRKSTDNVTHQSEFVLSPKQPEHEQSSTSSGEVTLL